VADQREFGTVRGGQQALAVPEQQEPGGRVGRQFVEEARAVAGQVVPVELAPRQRQFFHSRVGERRTGHRVPIFVGEVRNSVALGLGRLPTT
jgi:hypothetical protein